MKRIKQLIKHILRVMKITHYPNITASSYIHPSVEVNKPSNLIMEEDTNISEGSIIMNTRAKFVMKKWSGAAVGLTVVTGNHMSVLGMHFKQVTDSVKDELDIKHQMDKDVVVGEDVWIGSNVTLLSGVTIGRGSEIGSGCVIRTTVPPYAITAGNPAKIVGFRFTPEEIIRDCPKIVKFS